METVNVEYVGTKPTKTDTVAGTGLVWSGQGDVQPVPLKAWLLMARHTGVWRLADGESAPPPASAPAPAQPPVPPPSPISISGVLLGSDHPSEIDIEGTKVQLGEVVRGAFEASGLTEADWNGLPETDRRDFIDAHIEQLVNVELMKAINAAGIEAPKQDAAPAVAPPPAASPAPAKPAAAKKKAPAKKTTTKKK